MQPHLVTQVLNDAVQLMRDEALSPLFLEAIEKLIMQDAIGNKHAVQRAIEEVRRAADQATPH